MSEQERQHTFVICTCCSHCQKLSDSLEKKLEIAKEALEKIRAINPPVFNGEKVTTVNQNQIGRWQEIAGKALREIGE